MEYPELVKRVQNYSGFTRDESEDALQVMVESLSVHLPEPQRSQFARRLPGLLRDIALSVLPTEQNSKQDILKQVMELQRIDARKAKKQINASWKALSETIGNNRTKEIKSNLSIKARYLT